MGTDISKITGNILQVRANLKTEASGKENGGDFTVSFMELMNQGNLANRNLSADAGRAVSGIEGAKNSTAYDSYSPQSKSVSVKDNQAPEELQSRAAGAAGTYEEEVRKILKEELGVTDEEITEAMENLGMDFMNLLNPKDLTALVQELTGEDIGTLFLSEAFQNVMEQVSAAADMLCGELGITKEEWNLIYETLNQEETAETPGSEVSTGTEIPESVSKTPAENDGPVIAAAEKLPQEQAEAIVQKEDDGASEEVKRMPQVKETAPAEQTSSSQDEAAGTGSNEQELMEHSRDTAGFTEHTGELFTEQQAVRTEEFILPQEESLPYANQADALDLIDQIAKNVRVTLSASETSMEMQLNPENLGRIYLNVTEKEGVVRAQIAAQTETVKEALESQLAELRQSLNQQGIKVDAVEVTVGTHEFEQNLEENARQEEQMHQQMEEEAKKRGRRNLNLDDLDGLSGLMSEEEQLAAQIMRDNGNQVDFTA